ADYGGYHRHHVKHVSYLSAHFSFIACLKERLRLAVAHPQHPDLSSFVGIELKESERLPVRGPGSRNLDVLARSQPLKASAPVGELPENVGRPFLGRPKRDPLAIRRPNWAKVFISFKREPAQRLPGEIVQPDLLFDQHG